MVCINNDHGFLSPVDIDVSTLPTDKLWDAVADNYPTPISTATHYLAFMNRMSDATEFTAADFAPAALSKISGKMSPREMLKCGLIAPLTTAGKRYAVVVVQAIEPTVESTGGPHTLYIAVCLRLC
jgi:hypothetical protein